MTDTREGPRLRTREDAHNGSAIVVNACVANAVCSSLGVLLLIGILVILISILSFLRAWSAVFMTVVLAVVVLVTKIKEARVNAAIAAARAERLNGPPLMLTRSTSARTRHHRYGSIEGIAFPSREVSSSYSPQ